MNYQLLFSGHHLWDPSIVLFPFFFNFPPFTGYDTQIIHPSSLFVVSLFFKSFRILNCHAFDSAEMKIGQMKKVPLGLWRERTWANYRAYCARVVEYTFFFFFIILWAVSELQKEQQISQTYQAFLRGSETRQEILHANISKTKFSFVISFSLSLLSTKSLLETNDCLATLLL